MEYADTGARIKMRRKSLGLSAVELAERLSMSKATIHRYENGDIKNIKLPVVESIARELNVNPLWLIGKSEDMASANSAELTDRHMSIENVIDDVIAHVRSSEGMLCYGKKLTSEDRGIIVSSLETLKMLVAIKCR